MKNLRHVFIRKVVDGRDLRLTYLSVCDDWAVTEFYDEEDKPVYTTLCRGNFKRCFAYFKMVAKIHNTDPVNVSMTIHVE
jgi:hypothetical protein